jgi:HlyD family secretion protein
VATDIFRKVSLERLSSPEQLDRTLTVTPTRSWIALLAVLLLLGLTVAWGFEGVVSTTSFGQGVIVRSGGVLNVVSAGSGVVTEMHVKVGDRIHRNQVIAQVAQPDLTERIQAIRENIGELQRQREVGRQIRAESVKLQVDSIARLRENAKRDIQALEDQSKLVAEQIPVEAELLAKGLITRQQTFAAKQKLVDLESQVAAQNAQLKQFDAQQYSIESSPVEADIEMQSRIADLQRTEGGLQQQLELAGKVVSPYNGEVIELQVVPGSTVSAGVPLLSLQPDLDQLEVLVYVPSAKAKEIRAGMDAQISPTTVRREEYGFLRAKVVSVADYPATPAALMRNFQNETLVKSLLGEGPITELLVSLQPDPKSSSKFLWSSPLGPPVTLSSGTLCNAQIITRQQRPVSLVIPYFKEKLGVN